MRCRRVLLVLGLLFGSSGPTAVLAQFDFLKGLFGRDPNAPTAGQFKGYTELGRASQLAQQKDWKGSLAAARAAFVNGPPVIERGEMDVLTRNVLQLVEVWETNGAPPDGVASTLIDIVLPLGKGEKLDGPVYPLFIPAMAAFNYRPYPTNRESLVPQENLTRRMLQAAIAQKKTAVVNERLAARFKRAEGGVLARAIAVQLAAAEGQEAELIEQLKALRGDVSTVIRTIVLEATFPSITAAMTVPNARPEALAVLEAVIVRASSLPEESTMSLDQGVFRLAVARQHLQLGQRDEACRIARAVAALPLDVRRMGGVYGTYMHEAQRDESTLVILDAGQIDAALELISQRSSERETLGMQSFVFPNVAAALGRELGKLPAEKRYQTLRRWALPDDDHPEFRDLTDFLPLDEPPVEFRHPDFSAGLRRCGLFGDLYSTTWDLVSTAAELGKLPALIAELAKIQPATSTSDTALCLAKLFADQAATDGAAAPSPEGLSAMIELQSTTAQNVAKWGGQNNQPIPLLTLATASEAAKRPAYRDVAALLAVSLIDHSKPIQAGRVRPHLRMLQLETFRALEPFNTTDSLWGNWEKLRPRGWVTFGTERTELRSRGTLPDIWCATQGHIQHIVGKEQSYVCFSYPLTGEFQLDFDGREGNWSEGYAGYGGATIQPFAYGKSCMLSNIGRYDHDTRGSAEGLLHSEPSNHYSVKVSRGKVEYRVNGQLFHRDDAGESAPWLTLGSNPDFTPYFRNFRVTGTPTIPARVTLLNEQRMRGWVSHYFNETQLPTLYGPRQMMLKNYEINGEKFSMAEEVTVGDEPPAGELLQMAPQTYDWQFTDGELESRKRGSLLGEARPSWFSYQRPLLAGDTLQYDYFRGDDTDTVLTLGRVCLRFTPQGVEQFWLTDGDLDAAGPSKTVLIPVTLNLKTREWNEIAVTRRDNKLQLKVNGVAGPELPLASALPLGEPRFGFYHDAGQTAVRVRNVTLSGDWPKEFNAEVRGLLEQPRPEEEQPSSKFFASAFDEQQFSNNAFAVYQRGSQLPAEERYAYLHDWVMPNRTHDLLRMAGGFTPTHPAPPVADAHPLDVAWMQSRQSVSKRMVSTGGNFVCPAILLVLSAIETNRLPELKAELDQLAGVSSLEMARAQHAMLAIIAILEDQPHEANLHILESARLITDESVPQAARWAELALASISIEYPSTRLAMWELLKRIREVQLQQKQPGSVEFERFARYLSDQLEYRLGGGTPEKWGTPLASRQWQAISQTSARSRGTGAPVCSWDVSTGQLALRGRHDVEVAYFQSPLRGDFELQTRVSHFNSSELCPMVAGMSHQLDWEQRSFRNFHVRTKLVTVPLTSPVKNPTRAEQDFRIAVKGKKYSVALSGQTVYETELDEGVDPWVGFIARGAGNGRFARNVTITGKPTIPAELDLLAASDLKGWLPDYYSDQEGESRFAWTRTEDRELVCDQAPIQKSRGGRLMVENILRYHRPLFEDGVIEYEFYYDPQVERSVADPARQLFVGGKMAALQDKTIGKTWVAPALDRLVCLLEPTGVKLHWLTDGKHDRTGLLPDNTFDPAPGEAPAGPLPLKERDWNSVRLAVQGDRLTIQLNGKPVLNRPLEPSNLRQFGFFHYVNESAVQVRKVRYRGEWPKQLPPVKDQELAAGPERLTESFDQTLPAKREYDFTKSNFPEAEFRGYNRESQQVQPTAAGLKFKLAAGKSSMQFLALSPKLALEGDFRITAEFESLKIVPGTSYDPSVELKTEFDDALQGSVVASESKTTKRWRSVRSRQLPDRSYSFTEDPLVRNAASDKAFRMRIDRKGANLLFYVAESNTAPFRLVAMRPYVDTEVRKVILQVMTHSTESEIEFVLKKLSIRAATIVSTD